MIKPNELPLRRSQLYDEVVIASNSLLGITVPLAVGDQPVFLIGKGSKGPSIWLWAPLDVTLRHWHLVVENNSSAHGGFRVDKSDRSQTIAVSINKKVLLRVKQVSPSRCVVDELDFRPLGLVVFGGDKGLQVGESFLAGNTFAEMLVAIGIAVPSTPDSQTEPLSSDTK